MRIDEANPDHVPDAGALRAFLDRDGRIAVYPRKDAVRQALLRWALGQILAPEEALTEPELNQRMTAVTDDPATLRRYLVERDLLRREPDGSRYVRP